MKLKFIFKLLIRSYLFILLFTIGITCTTIINAQTVTVKGKITDSSTGEGLIGATVQIQGTTKGTVTDVDGQFELSDVQAGSYNLIFSYISYEQQIQRADIKKGQTVEINVDLKPVSTELDEVKVVASKRSDTEMAMITSIRTSNLVANGISKQQISRSQDKDASEVIARVPGVTVRDGKFINVRGLDERYNVVWLNGIGAPSSEADRRAFSFDMLPSSLIDNIVLYKTPAPEIPADFAGAVVQLQTKNTVDVNSADVSYATGYRENTTFDDFYTYKGGKYDWLGFDDGTRAIPANFPSTMEFRDLADNPTQADKDKITELGRSFSKIWTPEKIKAIPDQSLLIGLNKKFLWGRMSIGNVTSINYSYSSQYRDVFRAAYQTYDIINDRPDTSYHFDDQYYSSKTRVGGLFNWVFVFGNNQKIEFRNFFNQISDKHTVQRLGRDFYGGSYINAQELSFQSRSIYSGQISGNFNFNSSLINLNWTLGLGYTNKLQPDIRRVERNKSEDAPKSAPYVTSINFNADPKLLGRLTLKNYEHNYVAAVNYSHKIKMSSFTPEIKTGVFIEWKERTFNARNIGFAISNVMSFNWDLIYVPIDELFKDENINYTDGIKVDESTNLSDSYNAENRLYAAYAGLNLPFRRLKTYLGVRMEKNIQTLEGHSEIGEPISVDNNFFDLFPSLNASYNFTENALFRVAYGRTVNRPEFREIAPYTYYNFEEKATYYGNPELTNSYINNAELRFEYFPSAGDMITFGGFYKHFTNPIEAHLKDYGTGWNYQFVNSQSAHSYGLELDLRKTLTNLSDQEGFLRTFKDFVVVFNAALIKSELKTDDPTERDKKRKMQGQSPYIINGGIYYDNPKIGFMVSMLYNIIGERIVYVGDINDPHVYQMPRHLVDLTLNKKLGKYLTIKAGIKDIFNQPVELRQYETVPLPPGDTSDNDKRIQKTQVYRPGSLYSLGFTVNL